MKILVDADSCPKQAREIILRRAKGLNLRIIFAANRHIPGSEDIEMEICPLADNSADDRLVELAENGDLAVTRDMPLAKKLVEKGVYVMDDRGRTFTYENINELLSLRNFAVGLAENGFEIIRTANYGKKELKTFADSLDRLLTKLCKNISTQQKQQKEESANQD